MYGPLQARTLTTDETRSRDEERDSVTRQNAERWKRSCIESLLLRRRSAFLSISFSSSLFFRVPCDVPRDPLSPAARRGASFRDYILEIVNRMPADDVSADIPYISGDPFFEHKQDTRSRRRGYDLKIPDRVIRRSQSDKTRAGLFEENGEMIKKHVGK